MSNYRRVITFLLSAGIFLVFICVGYGGWTYDLSGTSFTAMSKYVPAKFKPLLNKLKSGEELTDEEKETLFKYIKAYEEEEETESVIESEEETDTDGEETTIRHAEYNEEEETITYTDLEGEEQTVSLEDLGISKEWVEELMESGGDLNVDLREEGMLIVGYDEDSGAKKWEYDPSSRLAAHYEGDKDEETVTVITSEEVYADMYTGGDDTYIWASSCAEDPGVGPDGHFVVQRFNYDDEGSLESVEYFTWTSGDRQGVEKCRYMYRKDTVSDEEIETEYYNDPFPVDWDPVLEGTVVRDEYGRYWLETEDGDMYLLTFRTDGFDADGDGSSGAEEAGEIDWESLIGETIAVRGHQIEEDSEGGVYYDGEAAQVFSVVDIVEGDEEDYEELVGEMEDVAEKVDPVYEKLVGNGEEAEDQWVNLFNGEEFSLEDFNYTDHMELLMEKIVDFYAENIDDLEDLIEDYGTDTLQEAWEEYEEEQAQEEDDEEDDEAAEVNLGAGYYGSTAE